MSSIYLQCHFLGKMGLREGFGSKTGSMVLITDELGITIWNIQKVKGRRSSLLPCLFFGRSVPSEGLVHFSSFIQQKFTEHSLWIGTCVASWRLLDPRE